MPPAWKLKREAFRLFRQLGGIKHFLQGPWNRWKYDRFERYKVTRLAGERPALDDMAVLLIYQPNQLLESLFFELSHLCDKGVSVVLVANHPLSDDDLQRLKPYCYLIMTRPNIGYDFGGYRDGILEILDRGLQVSNLFVMNDSVWFPLRTDCTLIETAKASGADAFGIFQNTKSRRDQHHHLQSYFYRFNKTLLSDQRFRKLWEKLPFFRSKELVIRKLEVTLSGKFISWGYTVSPLVRPEDVAAAGEKLTDEELQRVAHYHATTSRRGLQIFDKLIDMSPSDPGWPAERSKALTKSRFRYYFIDGHPLVLFRHLDTPFLKKSREGHYYIQRRELVSEGFHSDFDPIIQREITGWNDAAPPNHTADGRDFAPLLEQLTSSDAKSSGKSS